MNTSTNTGTGSMFVIPITTRLHNAQIAGSKLAPAPHASRPTAIATEDLVVRVGECQEKPCQRGYTLGASPCWGGGRAGRCAAAGGTRTGPQALALARQQEEPLLRWQIALTHDFASAKATAPSTRNAAACSSHAPRDYAAAADVRGCLAAGKATPCRQRARNDRRATRRVTGRVPYPHHAFDPVLQG